MKICGRQGARDRARSRCECGVGGSPRGLNIAVCTAYITRDTEGRAWKVKVHAIDSYGTYS